jgi:hypothetical protein
VILNLLFYLALPCWAVGRLSDLPAEEQEQLMESPLIKDSIHLIQITRAFPKLAFSGK